MKLGGILKDDLLFVIVDGKHVCPFT